MDVEVLDRAIGLLEQANGALSAAVMSGGDAQRMLARYVRLEKLAGYGTAMLAARVGDASEVATLSGSSVGQARRTIETGRVVSAEPALAGAMAEGRVSLDQASEIARTVVVAPESVDELVETARTGSFQVLRDRARRVRLEAEDRDDLRRRQHQARRLRHWIGELGMVHLDAVLEPHVGVPIVARLEEAARHRARAAGAGVGFEQHLADGFADLAAGTGPKRRGSSAEVVVLVSHQITQRGWSGVGDGEICAIPGVGPIHPDTAREIAQDAFLSGVFYDGTDLRHLKRWTRSIPPEVRLALRLGTPPDFDGPRCVDCGRRLQLEIDHRQPYAAGGVTSLGNSDLRCPQCHDAKTRTDIDTIRSRQRRQKERNRRARHREPALLPRPP